MLERSRRANPPSSPDQVGVGAGAQPIQVTGPVEEAVPKRKRKNSAAVALGRLGGLKGGVARRDKLTPEQRSEIALHAAKARWSKVRDDEEARGAK